MFPVNKRNAPSVNAVLNVYKISYVEASAQHCQALK